ncbi:MAG: FecR domain-containing protein [Nitrospirae bacterium]|nr:FecR domain-containing protein [Nitrospirota bacterium]
MLASGAALFIARKIEGHRTQEAIKLYEGYFSGPQASTVFILGLAPPVEYRRSGEKAWKELAESTALSIHDTVRTGSHGAIDLSLEPGVAVRVGPDSEFALAKLVLDALGRAKDIEVSLVRGRIISVVDWLAQGASFQVATRTATAGVRGTVFMLELLGELLNVHVLEGTVEVTTPEDPSHREEVGEGDTLEVSRPAARPGFAPRPVFRRLKVPPDIESQMERATHLARALPPRSMRSGDQGEKRSPSLRGRERARALLERRQLNRSAAGEKRSELQRAREEARRRRSAESGRESQGAQGVPGEELPPQESNAGKEEPWGAPTGDQEEILSLIEMCRRALQRLSIDACLADATAPGFRAQGRDLSEIHRFFDAAARSVTPPTITLGGLDVQIVGNTGFASFYAVATSVHLETSSPVRREHAVMIEFSRLEGRWLAISAHFD